MPSTVILIGATLICAAVAITVLWPILRERKRTQAEETRAKAEQERQEAIQQIMDNPERWARNERDNALSSAEYAVANNMAESMEEQTAATATQMQEIQASLRYRPGVANLIIVSSMVANIADIVLNLAVAYTSMDALGLFLAPIAVLLSTVIIVIVKSLIVRSNTFHYNADQDGHTIPRRNIACICFVGIILLSINFIGLFNNAGNRAGVIYDGQIKEAQLMRQRIQNDPEQALDSNHEAKLASAEAKIASIEAEKEKSAITAQWFQVFTFMAECLTAWFLLEAQNTRKFEKLRKSWERNRKAHTDAIYRRDGILSDRLNAVIRRFQEIGLESDIAMREFGRDVRFGGPPPEPQDDPTVLPTAPSPVDTDNLLADNATEDMPTEAAIVSTHLD